MRYLRKEVKKKLSPTLCIFYQYKTWCPYNHVLKKKTTPFHYTIVTSLTLKIIK